MRRAWLDSQEEEVRHARVTEPTVAWMVLVTVMKTSRVIVVCPGLWQIMGNGQRTSWQWRLRLG